MPASHNNGCRVTSGQQERGGVRAIGLTGSIFGVERPDRQVVGLRSYVSDTGWGDDHRDELQHLEGGIGEPERKDVLISAGRMVAWEPGNVRGIIEIALPFCLNETGIVLPQTFETAAAWRGDMSPPVGAANRAIRHGPNDNPAVDYRDQVGIREEVQDRPWPWPVDAAEQDVAVECRLAPVRFDNAKFKGLNPWPRSPGASAKPARQRFDLRARKCDITLVRVEKAIEIDRLDAIEIDQPQVLDASPGKRLPHDLTDVAGADDAYP
jgi:hypothetical protein